MNETEAAILAGGFIVFALVSRRIDRLSITMPMVFIGLGVFAKSTGLIDFTIEIEAVTILGEVTLAVILFSDAARINVHSLKLDPGLPLRLLLIGLPLCIMVGTLCLMGLFPNLSVAEVALIAAILAPTDAALGKAVVENKMVPERIRQALNVESGLNDGLALPAVTIFIAIVLGETNDPGFWVSFIVRQVGLGIGVGITIGVVIGWLAIRSRDADWLEPRFGQLAMFALAIFAYTASDSVGANGFIAAFVAGLSFGSIVGRDEVSRLDEFSEDSGLMLAALTFFVFGNVFVLSAFEGITFKIVIAAILILTISRMLPVAIAMTGQSLSWQTIGFIGWFGPRGLASMLFGLLLFDRGIERAQEFFGIITITIVGSVVLHGLTAAPGARAYGKWFAENGPGLEAPVASIDGPVTRHRWESRQPPQ